MFTGRRLALVGAGVAIWYVCIVAFWALQPLTDSVPVGVDYTLSTPTAVSMSVDCNTLFDSAARDGAPLPVLKAQPQGDPALGYQRTPCAVGHGHARVVFAIDTVIFLGLIGCIAWLAVRGRRSSPCRSRRPFPTA